jgi:hypothetical protein
VTTEPSVPPERRETREPPDTPDTPAAAGTSDTETPAKTSRPSGSGRRRPRAANFTTIAAAAFIGAVLIVIALLQLASNQSVKNQLGERVFIAGRAADLARDIAVPGPDGRRGPLLFPALLRDRDIYLQHVGSDPMTGWLAFEARAPGAPRTCVLQWVDAQNHFRDPCGAKIYPADGAGLVHYSATVNPASKRVEIDLRRPIPYP